MRKCHQEEEIGTRAERGHKWAGGNSRVDIGTTQGVRGPLEFGTQWMIHGWSHGARDPTRVGEGGWGAQDFCPRGRRCPSNPKTQPRFRTSDEQGEEQRPRKEARRPVRIVTKRLRRTAPQRARWCLYQAQWPVLVSRSSITFWALPGPIMLVLSKVVLITRLQPQPPGGDPLPRHSHSCHSTGTPSQARGHGQLKS